MSITAGFPGDFWLEEWERQGIIAFHPKNPLEGYRRWTFMMHCTGCGQWCFAWNYLRIADVFPVMQKVIPSVNRWTVAIGAAVFIGVLFISAYWEADIRWLHFFQTWMYLATIILVWKGNKWGYFIGVGTAALWNYMTLFVNTFLKQGLNQASILVHMGHLPRPDLFISVLGWLGNLMVIVGCVLAYGWTADKRRSDILKFALALAGTTSFYALIVALFQPRYLGLFPGLLHPHLYL